MTVPGHRLRFSEADRSDWPAIWQIIAAVLATGDTYPYPPEFSEEQARRIWMKDGDREGVFVAWLDDDIVGTAYMRANGVGLADHIANAGWMVAPVHQGEGVGRPFAEYVMGRARDMGYRAMQFNGVVASNTAAITLWQSLGFEIVGTVPDAFRHARDGLTAVHVMYRSL